MFNLLPEIEKKAIRSDYHFRLFIVTLGFVAATLLVAATLTLPSYFVLSLKENGLVNQLETLGQSQLFKRANELDMLLRDVNKKLVALKPTGTEIYTHELFQAIVAVRGGNITVRSMSFLGTQSEIFIQVTGVARSRDSLTSFAKRLEASPLFSSVEVPVANFTQDRDIAYSIKVMVDQKEKGAVPATQNE